ncbi:DUF748 domain-containing protein [Flavobacterium sp. UMI-01]|uniref:DUF748 domain-containing protein n=1 Tax=Flavobacterium sp. UMI-01 TaxID=1441053 RepID=UPI001C7D11D4|nr:DUF748 domain-containing protein [Flavobacterium sp. UMI-01]GIZ08182.1 hypothetical protein FUMI01_09090 [Flavobacterium sp. UMI-01]
MNKKYLIFLSLLFLVIATVFTVQGRVKNYIKNSIEKKLPSALAVKYTDLDIAILLGTVSVHNAELKLKSHDSLEYHTILKTKKLQLQGVGYWELLFNKTLSVKNLNLEAPTVTFYPYKKVNTKKTDKTPSDQSLQFIKIKEFSITNGAFQILRKSKDSIQLSMPSFDFKLFESRLNLGSEDAFPLKFENYKLDAQNIILDNNAFSKITMDSLWIEKKDLVATNFEIVPKYTKKELSKHLKNERDYINLKIPKISFKKFDFDYGQKRVAVTSSLVQLIQPHLEIYRDKLIADDMRVKPLYSKSLRDLSFDLNIKELNIKKGYISYAELVEPNQQAGKLFFNEVNASLYAISNLKKAKKTEIKVQSKLMGTAPLKLNWSFDVNNSSDAFSVTGSVHRLDATRLNPFFKPNLNAIAEGTLEQMYFSFNGNHTHSKGKMKMKYDDFNFKILRKNSNKINTFLTAIGNIFIHNDSDTKPNDFRIGEIEAERDATKSFFNYLWINVKSGIVDTLTGNEK